MWDECYEQSLTQTMKQPLTMRSKQRSLYDRELFVLNLECDNIDGWRQQCRLSYPKDGKWTLRYGLLWWKDENTAKWCKCTIDTEINTHSWQRSPRNWNTVRKTKSVTYNTERSFGITHIKSKIITERCTEFTRKNSVKQYNKKPP